MMTPVEIKLVKESWARIDRGKNIAAEVFYPRLFNEFPEVRQLFTGDIYEQGNKFVAMLNQIVRSLEHFERLNKTLEEAGLAHRVLGVTKPDYGKVAPCLLWTLEQELGEHFTDDVKDAWTKVYFILCRTMIDGAGYNARLH